MRDEKLSSHEKGVEFDPHYSEIEFLLAQFDSQNDPLNYMEEISSVNWSLIFEHSVQLLAKCFDLRVALWRLRAQLHLEGISAFYASVTQIDSQYAMGGVTLFPQADIDQPAESLHAAALGWLATSQCLHDMRNSRVFADNPMTVNELLNLRTQGQEGRDLHFSEAVKIVSQANALFTGQGLPALQEQLDLGVQALERIEHYANAQARDYRLDCRSVREYLQGLSRLLGGLEQQGLPVIKKYEPKPLPGEDSTVIPDNRPIRSRQEAILLLDQVLDYFQQYEPSHPAPILIRRSQKMIGMDFAAIVEELLPESLTSLTQISGK
ncbi:ImpA family type VI secretion system protein [Pseudomonas chlororaphis]|uniref:Type VI secretion protein, TssA family n=1 Tax=Pseudomonas chlororaphis O6 TaxID=1037915 RepID=A0AB33X102_9PSED|nr:type VI secretion system ImpA family N-terminal domain-containing protein [Pseudomonas chlororaphis]EIM18700.1 type VI secretion protein, TssA family [Pseudomonas chlororaphis O6]